jgi:hypothetical protein
MFMRAGLIALFPILASCATSGHVSARSDPSLAALPQEKLDRVNVGWHAHGGMAVTLTTRISPSDWIAQRSIRVKTTEQTILVCYSIVPRPGATPGAPPEPIRLTFNIPGFERAEQRKVLVSSSCGR